MCKKSSKDQTTCSSSRWVGRWDEFEGLTLIWNRRSSRVKSARCSVERSNSEVELAEIFDGVKSVGSSKILLSTSPSTDGKEERNYFDCVIPRQRCLWPSFWKVSLWSAKKETKKTISWNIKGDEQRSSFILPIASSKIMLTVSPRKWSFTMSLATQQPFITKHIACSSKDTTVVMEAIWTTCRGLGGDPNFWKMRSTYDVLINTVVTVSAKETEKKAA